MTIVAAIISTKRGVGKTTTAANLGAYLADARKRVLLIDTDIQPTLSSYYRLTHEAPGGIFELLSRNDTVLENVVSRTVIPNLDIILSNDDRNQLSTMLLNAADGRLRLFNLLSHLTPHYDLILIDTQGARSVTLEMALLASDLAVSPVIPEMLAAREFHRGTLKLFSELQTYSSLGLKIPPLKLFINRADYVSVDAKTITATLRQTFAENSRTSILDTSVPGIAPYKQAATLGEPVHRVEPRRPSGRKAPAALETMRDLALEQSRYQL